MNWLLSTIHMIIAIIWALKGEINYFFICSGLAALWSISESIVATYGKFLDIVNKTLFKANNAMAEMKKEQDTNKNEE